MNIISELAKERGFFIVLTNNMHQTFELILEQIKSSRCLSYSSKLSACNSCESCKEFVDNRYYYIFKFTKNDVKQIISIEKIREWENYFYMKVENKYKKYFIVENAENLTVEAQNHMLKILEEIPNNTFFFFLCKNINSVLPTILSRARKFFVHSEVKEEVWDEYEELKNIYQYIVDFWSFQKKKDINLYEMLKNNIILNKNINYEEKQTLLKLLLDRIGNKIIQDFKHSPYLLYIVEEILELIMRLKYNIGLEVYIMDLYIKIVKWKNLQNQ